MVQTLLEKNVEEDTQKVAAEVQLQKYGQFFEDFSANVKHMEKLLHFECNSGHDCGYPASRQRIFADYRPEERIDTIQELINSENKIIDKVLSIFCKLCDEVSFLQREAKIKYVGAILCYGEGIAEDAPYEDCQLLISKTLPLLQSLSNFIIHCERVVFDILSQLSAFYRLHFEITDVNLHTVFDSLAVLLSTLVVLEDALSNNNTLLYHWSLYRRTIQVASHKASDFPHNSRKLRQLGKLIDRLEAQLLSRKIFENLLNMNFEKKSPVKRNKCLEEEFANYLKMRHTELDKLYKQNCTNMTKLTKLGLMFVLHINIFGSYDKKLLKGMVDLLKKFPLVTLHSNVQIQLNTFIAQHAGPLLKSSEKKMFEKDMRQCLAQCLSDVTQRMNKDVQYYASSILLWALQMESKLRTDVQSLHTDYVKEVCSLLVHGLNYSKQMKTLLLTVSNLHMSANKPMYKTSALSFCTLVELIKCVRSVYTRHHAAIFKTINNLVQYMQHQCLVILNNNKRNVANSDKRFEEIRVDAMSSLVIAENCLGGLPTRPRLTVIALCLDLANQAKCLNETDHQKLCDALDKLEILTSLQEKLNDLSECEFMYWNKSVLAPYLEDIEKKQLETNRIWYMFEAMENGYRSLEGLIDDHELTSNQIDGIADAFVERVTQPKCRKMEVNLRLHALSHLQQNEQNLQQTSYDLNNFERARPFNFGDKCLDLKYQVETYLSKTFYDLATVALHDWQIYGEMRMLAKHKFDLNVAEDGLPNQTLEQGPDLLEITRNIQTFVTNHFYNLNNQIFIEMSSNNKHLNVINIQHTTNSICTHGAGIMSTAVNYTYQFLCTKLNHFSQFLYDEQIKSRLLKEEKLVNEQLSCNAKYPFERAERFHKSIRKLGVKGDGTTYIDQFRTLITQMGNALGYVRLIRSGGLRFFSNAIAFVPNLKGVIDLQPLKDEEQSSPSCRQGAANLDHVITSMCHNMAEGTNYFKLLVDVFTPVIQDHKNDHFRFFYTIVPALTINFVEYMITAKEGLSKRNNKTRVTFTDDGFVMGVAYLLHMLQQYSKFDSLQWFQSVRERNQLMKEKLVQQEAQMPKDDSKLNHTLRLSLQRLEVYDLEFQHLYYNLYSAQVLFQDHHKRMAQDEDQ